MCYADDALRCCRSRVVICFEVVPVEATFIAVARLVVDRSGNVVNGEPEVKATYLASHELIFQA